jgi:methionyl aminopeptidase
MSIDNDHDLEALRRVGRVVAEAIREMRRSVRPGVTTNDLDAICSEVLQHHRARPAPRLVYGFPGVACISVNDEAAHGVASARVVVAGDLVKLDVTAELDGYFADACETVPVPPVSRERQRLTGAAEAALDAALRVAEAGVPISRIGAAAELSANRRGFRIVRDLFGHGVGRSIHEQPSIPHFATRAGGQRLTDGLVIAIEPHLTSGSGRVVSDRDGWTIRSADGRPVANFEQTVVVRQGTPLIVTAV